jgi:predicted O-methyltransferase YrrM
MGMTRLRAAGIAVTGEEVNLQPPERRPSEELTGMPATPAFDVAWTAVAHVDGWLTEHQARRLFERASELRPPAQVVEIGSFRGRSAIVLAKGIAEGVDLVAIDPHAGTDRGPREMHTTADTGQTDHDVFMGNLRTAGVDGRVRHVRHMSNEALELVDGDVQLLYIDGAHRYEPALDDIRRWGARVPVGGTMLIHDSWNAVGVTLAQLRELVLGARFRYVGRSTSMSEYRREDLGPVARIVNAARQLLQLGYFAQSVAIKVALTAKQAWLARLLGHRSGSPWPY